MGRAVLIARARMGGVDGERTAGGKKGLLGHDRPFELDVWRDTPRTVGNLDSGFAGGTDGGLENAGAETLCLDVCDVLGKIDELSDLTEEEEGDTAGFCDISPSCIQHRSSGTCVLNRSRSSVNFRSCRAFDADGWCCFADTKLREVNQISGHKVVGEVFSLSIFRNLHSLTHATAIVVLT